MPSWEKQIFETLSLPIGKGEVSGHENVFISGVNTNVQVSLLPVTVWNVGGAYPWSVWDTGPHQISLVSTSASDTSQATVIGLDSNYDPLVEVVTLTGLSAVTTTNSFLRVNSISCPGNVGVVTAQADSTTIGRISATVGLTQMSIYTVPAGHTAYQVCGDFSVNKNESAQLTSRWRFYGTNGFMTVYATESYQQFIRATPPIPGAIPEKSDIDIMVDKVGSNGTRVYSNQQMVLVKDQYLHK